MINEIIQAIGSSLSGEFGDSYTNYTEESEQGFEKPCFFISCVTSVRRPFMGKRYFCESQFCIQYTPADGRQIKEECNAVTERLFSCLEYLTVAGEPVRGSNMKVEFADGLLKLFVNYNLFVYKAADSVSMEELSKKVSVKG